MTDDDETIFFLITTFNPNNYQLRDIVLKNWDILKCSSVTKEPIHEKSCFRYRKCPNLKDILACAKLKPKRDVKPHPKSAKGRRNECKTRNCNHCPMLSHTGRIISTYTGMEYSCKKNVACKSSNLIYCIQCKTCKMQYVGETSTTIMKRMEGHLDQIQCKVLSDDIGKLQFARPSWQNGS